MLRYLIAGERAARVAAGAGACAKALLARLGTSVVSHVVQMGPIVAKSVEPAYPRRPRQSRCLPGPLLRPRRRGAMIAEIRAAAEQGDYLGGVVEVLAYGNRDAYLDSLG